MNAYELADELRKMFQGDEYDRLVHEIPDMLRQQADRIAELEKQLYFKDYYEELPDTPVGLQTTPQTKPLSDVEISLIAEEFTGADGLDVVDFGRAIQERHGIK